MASSGKSVEYERTFLASRIPDEIKKAKPLIVSDLYIPEDSQYPVLRLRRSGDNYELTKKTAVAGSNHSVHNELTVPLDKVEFEALQRSSHRSVTKRRYKVKIDGHGAEVDVFDERLSGLILIDFEFSNEQLLKQFNPPDCCLTDVTEELFIHGGQLAGSSYESIKADLDKFGYTPLYF